MELTSCYESGSKWYAKTPSTCGIDLHRHEKNACGLLKRSGTMLADLSGETVLYPCIGDPIAQVKSPRALTQVFADRGCNAIVVPVHVNAVDFYPVINALGVIRNIAGALITVPHKLAAARACPTVTERANFTQSVNVMRRTLEGWFGDATDGQGYLDGIEQKGFHVAGKRALLIGCGGAGTAIALELLRRGVAELAIHDIDTDRRDQSIRRLAELGSGTVRRGTADPVGYDLIANATPLGMRQEDPLPVDVTRLRPEQFVACVVTRPEVPPLIAEAQKNGCMTMTGTEMFEAQAETLVDFLLSQEGAGLRKEPVS